MKFKQLFTENLQSEKDLIRIISDYIIPKLAREKIETNPLYKCPRIILDLNKNFHDVRKINDPIISDYYEGIAASGYIELLAIKKENTAGQYIIQKKLTQIFDVEELFMWDKLKTKEKEKIIHNKYLNILAHELQHAYDAIKSERKAFQIYAPMETNFDDYLKQDTEVNARFLQAISATTDSRKYSTFNYFFKEFIEKFRGYKLLDRHQKQRILNRALDHYNSEINPKDKELWNSEILRIFRHILDNGSFTSYKYNTRDSKYINQDSMRKYIKSGIKEIIKQKINYDPSKSLSKNKHQAILAMIRDLDKTIQMYQDGSKKHTDNKQILDIFDRQLKKLENALDVFEKEFGLTRKQLEEIWVRHK